MIDATKAQPNVMYKHRMDRNASGVGGNSKPKVTRLDRENELWDAYFTGAKKPRRILKEIKKLRREM